MADLPFHGGNRGSNPLGDATNKIASAFAGAILLLFSPLVASVQEL